MGKTSRFKNRMQYESISTCSQASQFNHRQGREDDDAVVENEEISATEQPTEEAVEQDSEAVEQAEVMEESEAVEQPEAVEQSEATEEIEAVEPSKPAEPSGDEDWGEVVVDSSSATATVVVTATQTVTSTGPMQTLR